MKVNSFSYPSEAIFKTALGVDTSFGVPVFASAEGLEMDVDRLLSLTKALDGDNAKKRQFLQVSGMNSSALEHSVPEQLFRTPESHVEGVSAVKALQLASEQGIPIYTVTQDNIDTVAPQLQLAPEVINDIRNAVNAGNEVTVSKTDINFNGWVGCGYIVTNPITGEGAYMISGGYGGGAIKVEDIEAIWYGVAINFILWGPIIMGVGLAVPIAGLALFGAVIVGLGIGMVLSQVMSEELKDFMLELLASTEVVLAILTTMAILGVSTALFGIVAALLLYNLYVQTRASVDDRFLFSKREIYV